MARADGAELRVPLGSIDASANVKSWLEIRGAYLVRQQWDISCGAAALSTILTHDFHANRSELAVAISMLANADPAVVRARGGFSLLDLKRYANAVGFVADGYGGMSLNDLEMAGAPAILPVRIRALDHFIVFRERIAGKVLIGDPAFGNLLLPERQFLDMWKSRIALLIRPAQLNMRYEPLSLDRMQLPIPDLNHVYRVSRGAGELPGVR